MMTKKIKKKKTEKRFSLPIPSPPSQGPSRPKAAFLPNLLHAQIHPDACVYASHTRYVNSDGVTIPGTREQKPLTYRPASRQIHVRERVELGWTLKAENRTNARMVSDLLSCNRKHTHKTQSLAELPPRPAACAQLLCGCCRGGV